MLGAIAGDVIGSVYERRRHKRKDFPLFSPQSCFTDDTVLTVAVADVVLHGGDYAAAFQRYFSRYPRAGYGVRFSVWAETGGKTPLRSFGNGSAMRVSPVGWAFHDLDAVLEEARRSAECTHGHPEGIKGAQATAAGVFLARTTRDKQTVRDYIQKAFGYDLGRRTDDIRRTYGFDVTCQGSVPEAIIAFLDGADYEDSVRNAVSLGGDADTQACIAGGLAEAFHGGVPDAIARETMARLDAPLRAVVEEFRHRYLGA